MRTNQKNCKLLSIIIYMQKKQETGKYFRSQKLDIQFNARKMNNQTAKP